MAQLLHTSFIPSSSSSTTLRRKPTPPVAIRAEIFMPALSSTKTEGKIVSWAKSEGDKLAKGDNVVVVVVESDKADMDVETFYDSYSAAIMVDEGGVAAVGSLIGLLAETKDEIALAWSKAVDFSSSSSLSALPESQPEKNADNVGSGSAAKAPRGREGRELWLRLMPKKMAKELKVELGRVVGTGPMGRIVAKDVEAAAVDGLSSTMGVDDGVAGLGIGKSVGIELETVVPFTTMQGALNRNMVESLAVPTFKVGYTITTNALDALYKKIKSKGVTMTALLAKATTLALVKHLVINSIRRDGKSFTYNRNINIAVTVAIDGRLITPVLQDVDKVDIYSLSRKWNELVDKARTKQL